jgi:hypothetical protein
MRTNISPTVLFWDRAGNAGAIATFDALAKPTENITPTVIPGEETESSFRIAHTANIAGISFHWTASADL